MIRVALDGMGGDHGADAAVQGAAMLSREDADIQILLVGDVEELSRRLDGVSYDPTRLVLVGANGVVEMGQDARQALEAMPDCSAMRAARLVAEGEADAWVSAGHTGATVLASARHFERLPGVRRAALASVYPTEAGHGPRQDPFALMLDVGATLTASAEDLLSFAVMGSAYSSIVSEIESPRVALLSNGAEPNKGTPEIVKAHARLLRGPVNFAGNVEGLDIPRGTVDVVVCDGFLGNVVLKMLEGVGEVFRDMAREAPGRRRPWWRGVSRSGGGLRELKKLWDWKSYGGAPLLGLDAVVIKAHGRSEGRALRNAVKVAAKAVRGDVAGRIRRGMAVIGEGA